MNREEIQHILEQSYADQFYYPWKLFEMRIQEEMIRSDRSGTSFALLEVGFDALDRLCMANVSLKDSWKALLHCIGKRARGSDIRGFLTEDKGVGIVFTDIDPATADASLARICQDLLESGTLSATTVEDVRQFLRHSVYPQSVRGAAIDYKLGAGV